MSEILQIFQHSPPPPYHQMPTPHIQRGMVNADSRCNPWSSIDSSSPPPDIFDGMNNFEWSELEGSQLTNFSSSSVDELSKVTAVVGDTRRSFKKRKLEFDDAHIGLHERPNTKRETSPNGKSNPDYILVRARRGQATDNHSIAERARREKIKKKMQLLQDMVPGCNKITNRAAILDEIITYVQTLQMEVEFLTMQLAASTTLQDGQLIGQQLI